MQEDTLVEHGVHVAGKCILSLEVGLVGATGTVMHIVVDELLICCLRELVLHVLHTQEVVFFVGGTSLLVLDKQFLLLSAHRVSPLLLILNEFLIIMHNVDVLLAKLRTNRMLLS